VVPNDTILHLSAYIGRGAVELCPLVRVYLVVAKRCSASLCDAIGTRLIDHRVLLINRFHRCDVTTSFRIGAYRVS